MGSGSVTRLTTANVSGKTKGGADVFSRLCTARSYISLSQVINVIAALFAALHSAERVHNVHASSSHTRAADFIRVFTVNKKFTPYLRMM